MPAKKFKFRLEPLLKIRKHREKERQKDHAAAASKVMEQQNRLGTLDGRRLDTIEYSRRKSVGKLSITDALIASRYLMRLRKERMAGSELLHALERTAGEKRKALVQAARERKIFERLKEKQEEKFRDSAEKDEQKELDEVATGGFFRPSPTKMR